MAPPLKVLCCRFDMPVHPKLTAASRNNVKNFMHLMMYPPWP